MSYPEPDPIVARILDTAEQLLAIAPTGTFTMDELAQQAGVSRATLYRRLGSKEALLQRLAEERGLEIGLRNEADIPRRILQAARTAFGRSGLARTTMEEIAAEAGLGVATVYRHFGDRDNLVRAFLEEHAPQRAFQDVASRASGDIEADLVHLVTEMLTFLHENRDMIWLGLVEGAETQSLLARLLEAPQGARGDIVHFLEAAVDAGHLQDHDPEQMATALAGMLLSFALPVPIVGGGPLHDVGHTAEFIVHLFLEGLGVQPPIS